MSFLYSSLLLLVLFASQELFPQPTAAQKSSPITSIRNVDFYNFTYPLPKDMIDPANRKRSFKLKQGELPATRFADGFVNKMGIFLAGKIRYGDVTGDGTEEAMIFMSILTGGSALPGIIYVYTIQNNRPQMLWNLTSGDRADGGFRDMYAENGHLVVELSNSIGKRGDCCPVKYDRTVYEWRGSRFRPIKKQTLPIQQPN